MVPADLDELYQLYARDIDEGQLIHDLKSKIFISFCAELFHCSTLVSAHSPRSVGGNGGGKTSVPATLPFLSQIAEEDLTSASTSVTSFHLPNSVVRRTAANPMTNHRTQSDHDLFVRVNEDPNHPIQDSSSTTSKPTSYAHFNFDQSTKQLAKGNSMVSISSDSVDVPVNHADRRKVHTTSPPHDMNADPLGQLSKANPTNNKINLRKQTQDIAARAAQRRANRHHKELMEDMGKDLLLMHSHTNSSSRQCLGSVFSSEPVVSKENTASAFGLEITPVKPKKTVTINDPAGSRYRSNDLRRTNSESPEMMKHEPIPIGRVFSTLFQSFTRLFAFRSLLCHSTSSIKTRNKKTLNL